jgi:UMF1 family MFS transporter
MTSSAHSSSRVRIFSWALFDLANTSFYVVVLTVGYPVYFKKVVTESAPQADFLWGLAFSISMLCVAMLSPVLGAAADQGAGKKRFLGFFTALCILSTAGLFFVESSMIVGGIVLLVLANIGFEAGLVFYDAFLPEITTERSYGRVSGYGFAMGYVGSLVTLGLSYPLYVGGFAADNLLNVRLSFLLAAAMFFIFAVPVFLALPDRQLLKPLTFGIVRQGYSRVLSTFREISRYRNVARFLLAYFIYIDGVNTVIIFSSIFALETLKFEIAELVLFFALVQTSAIGGSAMFGIISDHAGHKRTLAMTLVLWLAVVAAAYFVESKGMFYGVGGLAGIALGSSQSVSRSLMSHLTPPEKRTEFFGFYSFFGKAAAILGPLLFGFVSSYVNQRVGIVSVAAFIVAGLFLLQRVHETTSGARTGGGMADSAGT